MGLDPEAIKMIQYSGGFSSLFNRTLMLDVAFNRMSHFLPPDAFLSQTRNSVLDLRHSYDQIIEELQMHLPETYIHRVVSNCVRIQSIEDSVPVSEMVVSVEMDQLKLVFKRR